jgi:hypothetical protein
MKFYKIVLFSACIVFFSACGNLTEEFTFKSDGSGIYTAYTDIVSGSIDMSTAMAIQYSGKEFSKAQKDSLKKVVTEKIWEGFPGEIDSVVDLLSELPDSVIKFGDNKEYSKRTDLFYKGSKKKGYVHAGVTIDFRNGEDFVNFSDYLERIQNTRDENNEGPSLLGSITEIKSDAEYAFEKKSFKRTVKFSDLDMEEIDPTAGLMMELFSDKGTYRTIVNTVRKISSVKGEYVVLQKENKVVFEYPFKEYMRGDVNTDFEIIFE